VINRWRHVTLHWNDITGGYNTPDEIGLGHELTSAAYRQNVRRREINLMQMEGSSYYTIPNGGDTQSRNLRKKLAQVSCASFLHHSFVQVHGNSADDTSNKNGRSWTKQITFSILSVDHSMGTQNLYLNNLNKFKK